MSNEKKIDTIKAERKAMLESLKASLEASSSETIDTLSEIKEVISNDEKSCKEYKAIKDAQNMILKFMQRIANAKEVDDIMDDREIVNYYINKIKRILNSRGVNSTEIDRLSSKVSGLRKGISGYIRFLKREKNIKRIDVLNKKSIKSLSEDEKEELKTLLKNEMAYAKRNSVKNQKEEIETSLDGTKPISMEPTKIESTAPSSTVDQICEPQIGDERDQELDEIKAMIECQPSDQELDEIKAMIEYQPSNNCNLSDEELLEDARSVIGDDSIDEDAPTSSKRAQEEYDHYLNFFISNDECTPELYEYGNSNLRNFILFLKNTQICHRAQNSSVLDARIGWLNYHNSDIYYAYYRYLKEKYSIRCALIRMFENTKLYSGEKTCLEEHEKCRRWLDNYLKRRDLRLSRTHN